MKRRYPQGPEMNIADCVRAKLMPRWEVMTPTQAARRKLAVGYQYKAHQHLTWLGRVVRRLAGYVVVDRLAE